MTKKIHACFSCLNIGHSTRKCRRKRVCSVEGCQRKHNKQLQENTSSVPLPAQSNNNNGNKLSHDVLNCSHDNKRMLFRVLHATLYGENRSVEKQQLKYPMVRWPVSKRSVVYVQHKIKRYRKEKLIFSEMCMQYRI